MEKYEDPVEVERAAKLKKLEEKAPQKYDYALALTNPEVTREDFFAGLEVLNQGVAAMPPAEGLYEEVHFRTDSLRTLGAKIFQNGRVTFKGSWNE